MLPHILRLLTSGTMIVNGNVSDSEALRHHSVLAGAGQIQNRGLSMSDGDKKQQCFNCE